MLFKPGTIAFISILGLLTPGVSAVTHAKSKKHRKSRKRAAKSYVAMVPPAVRASNVFELRKAMQSGGGASAFENESALVPFFHQLYRAHGEGRPLHILQFGDSHTASDDWTNAMRNALQTRFGDGGPGFADPGHPYRGYRNFRVPSGNSTGWHTEGTIRSPGDGREGLGGISLTTSSSGESVWMRAEGDELELFFLRQPGGGQLTFLVDGQAESAVSTNGPLGPGYFAYEPPPGVHTFEIQTVSADPVRLFGWVLQNRIGVTYETLGINGAQADLVATWDESTFGPQLQRRDPALIVFAYGTNEALSPRFTVAGYRAGFAEALARLRRASATASILVIGPPDCWLKRKGRLVPFPHMEQVIEIQREIAAQRRCAFWDWRRRMGGEGSKRRWVMAGLAQVDYVHFTSTGYQVIGNTLCADLMDLYNVFVSDQKQAKVTDEQKILSALKAVTKNEAVPGNDESLFDSGYLDSFALPDLVSELEKQFGITIPDSDLNPRKFESVSRIEAYVLGKKAN